MIVNNRHAFRDTVMNYANRLLYYCCYIIIADISMHCGISTVLRIRWPNVIDRQPVKLHTKKKAVKGDSRYTAL